MISCWERFTGWAKASFLETLKKKMKPLAGQFWCCVCHVTAAPRGRLWSLRSCQLAQGSWFKKKIWAQAYKIMFFTLLSSQAMANWALRVQLSPGRTTSGPSFSGLTSPLCLSFTQPSVFKRHCETQGTENVHKGRDNAVITQSCGSVWC